MKNKNIKEELIQNIGNVYLFKQTSPDGIYNGDDKRYDEVYRIGNIEGKCWTNKIAWSPERANEMFQEEIDYKRIHNNNNNMEIKLPTLKKTEPVATLELALPTDFEIIKNNLSVLYQEMQQLKSAIHFLQTLAVNKLSEQERYDLGIIEQPKADSQA